MFDVPKIYRPINLGEYTEELEGVNLYVWVNPPRKLRLEYMKALIAANNIDNNRSWLDRLRRKLGLHRRDERRVVEWFGKIWSEDGVEQIGKRRAIKFSLDLAEQDPVMWGFLVDKTLRLMSVHAEDAKKN